MKDIKKIADYHYEMESYLWVDEIPYINFPKDWNVKIIPPFGGAVVRFQVKKDEKMISVYLDCYDNLGVFGSPYWEIYPHKGDVMRIPMKEVNLLLSYIKISLQEQP